MTADQPPAITAEQPTDIVSVMQRLAALTPDVTKAQGILDSYHSEDARQMWRAVWGIESTTRAIALRKREPNAPIPPEWAPLGD